MAGGVLVAWPGAMIGGLSATQGVAVGVQLISVALIATFVAMSATHPSEIAA